MSAENVASGFLATGICPYNPGAIPDIAYAPAELYTAKPVNALDTAPGIEPIIPSVVPSSSYATGTVSATSDSRYNAVVPLATSTVSHNKSVEPTYVSNTSQNVIEYDSTTDTSLLTTSSQGEEIILSLDIHDDSGTIDLPLALTDDAMLELLQDQLPDFSGAATNTCETQVMACL